MLISSTTPCDTVIVSANAILHVMRYRLHDWIICMHTTAGGTALAFELTCHGSYDVNSLV